MRWGDRLGEVLERGVQQVDEAGRPRVVAHVLAQPAQGQAGVAAAELVRAWLAAAEHRPLLRLWAEAYARPLVEPGGSWAGFARATVDDWLDVLAACRPRPERDGPEGAVRRTLALAVLRGALLDLLATDDEQRVTAAVHRHLEMLRRGGGDGA
ncbi:TetR family transcriptional regulator [Streptomyces asoensis]|uniref:TetR family transcriptional regulator n=1 Tax=Streptomyces asoensis TaxID=249586 RepID=UPI0027DD5B34|nr:TetR family transcriptional regulator [Streptomyces asoensis]